MQYRANTGLIYGRLRHTGIILIIMAMSLMMWHNVEVVAEEKLDLNTATRAELDGLPGIGEVLSQRIIDYRERYGCFLDVYEILNIKGIGVGRFDGIKNLIYVTTSSCPCQLNAMEFEASKNRVREKIKKVQEEMNEDEKGRTTFAIAEVYVCCSTLDGHIETWISNAGQNGNIRQGILDAADPHAEDIAYPDDGEYYPRDGLGEHAEMGLLRKAQMDNVRILSIWATREICEDCESNLRKAGLNDEFVTLPCNVGSKGKLAAMWGEIRNIHDPGGL